MSMTLPFSPGTLVKLTAASTSAAYTLTGQSGQVIVLVTGSVPVIFKLAATAIVPDGDPATAGVGSVAVGPGMMATWTIGNAAQISYIRDGSSDSGFYLMQSLGS